MSKTDKDRPLWVQNAEHGHIDHDHRTGECIISDDQRDRWPAWHTHNRNCKKRVSTMFSCRRIKVDGKKQIVYDLDTKWKRDIVPNKSCWAWTCDCPHETVRTKLGNVARIYDDGGWWHGIRCDGRYFNECLGHYTTEHDDSIPCACDDRPPVATCTPSWEVGRYYTWGGVPSEFVRTHFHKPERARERRLDDYVREYNTYGELEDGDFDNRQARGSARWTWW